jgi:four helix bundle suffix protein
VARRCTTADEVAAWIKEIHNSDPRNQRPIPSMRSIPSKYAGSAANAALILIGVAVALLDRQIAAQAAAFEKDGGFTERLYRVRQSRSRN